MRHTTEQRRAQILLAATELARQHGYQNFTREQIAERVGYGSRSSINVHVVSMELLRTLVMEEAVRSRDLIIVAQGLATGNAIAIKAPQKLKRKAALTLV